MCRPSRRVQSTIGKDIWLDPTEDEARAASGSLILAGMPALGTVTNVWQAGRLTPEEAIQVSVGARPFVL